ncbi:hypothetical protein D9M71_627110 [compost metagenome]
MTDKHRYPAEAVGLELVDDGLGEGGERRQRAADAAVQRAALVYVEHWEDFPVHLDVVEIPVGDVDVVDQVLPLRQNRSR